MRGNRFWRRSVGLGAALVSLVAVISGCQTSDVAWGAMLTERRIASYEAMDSARLQQAADEALQQIRREPELAGGPEGLVYPIYAHARRLWAEAQTDEEQREALVWLGELTSVSLWTRRSYPRGSYYRQELQTFTGMPEAKAMIWCAAHMRETERPDGLLSEAIRSGYLFGVELREDPALCAELMP